MWLKGVEKIEEGSGENGGERKQTERLRKENKRKAAFCLEKERLAERGLRKERVNRGREKNEFGL